MTLEKMNNKRTVSVAGECFTLPFSADYYWVIDSEYKKVAEMGYEKTAIWLAQVLNEHFYVNEEQN